MGNRSKNLLKVLAIIIIVAISSVFIAQNIIESKIENQLTSKLPKNISLTYGELDFNIFDGSLKIDQITLVNLGETSESKNISATLKELKVNNLDYWSYLKHDKIYIDLVQLSSPSVSYYHNPEITEENYTDSNLINLKKELSIDAIEIKNSSISIYNAATDSLLLDIQKGDLSITDFIFNDDTKQQKTPIGYSYYELNCQDIFYGLGDYENLTIKNARITQDAYQLDNLKLITKYPIDAYDKMLTEERDHYKLAIDSIIISNPILTLDSIKSFESSKIVLYQPNFEVYRNKLLADDFTVKPMFSQQLRDLKFNMNINQVMLENGFIQYTEKVKVDRPPGLLMFSDFNATINNVSNTYKSPDKTTIKVDALFMDHAPFKHTMAFDVNDESDNFLFKAEIDDLNSVKLNAFTVANLNLKTEGKLDKTYFTISGNSVQSQIDLRARFHKFDVIVLKNDGREENKIISGVINIFVKKNSSDKDGFKEGHTQNIQRDRTKSVFNFIWISTRAGLIKAMTII